jgi:hypothetical protein
MENRIDRLTAVHVDLAVNVSVAFGLTAAVDASHELDIPPQVVQRVLIECGPRRGATLARPEPSSRGAPHIPHIA